MGTVEGNPFEAVATANALSHPAESYENHAEVEMAWAVKAYEHAEVYFNLIASVDPSFLRLCPHDNMIYEKFRNEFADFKVDKIEEVEMKSPAAKERWRNFSNQFEKVVENFNYGTLLRLDSTKGYNEENTIFAVRVQFLAIEIARNREGHNQFIYKQAQEQKKKEDDNKEKET